MNEGHQLLLCILCKLKSGREKYVQSIFKVHLKTLWHVSVISALKTTLEALFYTVWNTFYKK